MKHTLLIAVIILFTVKSKAQSALTNGWAILESTAGYTCISDDPDNPPAVPAVLFAGEVLYVIDNHTTGAIAYDIDGSLYLIRAPKGQQIDAVLKNAPAGTNNGVGLISKEITLISGNNLHQNMAVWISGQNVGQNTIQVTLNGGEKIDIPTESITLWSASIKAMAKTMKVKQVEAR